VDIGTIRRRLQHLEASRLLARLVVAKESGAWMSFLGPGIDGYQILLRELKARIRMARLQAALAVNEELILLYWGIGREILERQAREGWGSRVIGPTCDATFRT
jgi:hypothetical protein